MSDVLSAQLDLANSLALSISAYSEQLVTSIGHFNTQHDAIKSLNKSLEKTITGIQDINNSLEGVSEKLSKAEKIKYTPSSGLTEKIKDQFRQMIKSELGLENMSASFKSADKDLKSTEKSLSSTKKQEDKIKKASEDSNRSNVTAQKANKSLLQAAKDTCLGATKIKEFASSLKDYYEEMKSKTKSLFSSIASKATSIPGVGMIFKGAFMIGKFVIGIASIAWNVFTTSMTVFLNLTKTVMTLPFTIANSVIDVGNDLRTKVIEGIGNQVEAFKDENDLSSYVGQKLSNLGELSKDALLALQDNKSRLSKIFGMNNPEQILAQTKEQLMSLGPYTEVLGGTIANSIENVLFLTETQKAMGIGASEMKYYALEAFSGIRGIIDVMSENMLAIERVSDKENQNFKILSKTFHSLRTNIVQFGHLSANELAEVSSEIYRMKLSAEDVTAIFGKISSFEDAANMSAQLFQAFGMTIDAFDMVSADDPVEIIKQLREGMLITGKSFGTLNRHEKSLLKQLTGLSDHVLQTTFSYEGLTKTEEEFQKTAEKFDPVEAMTDSMRSMSSAIKSIIKIMNFSNPFEALWDGLMEAASRNSEMADTAMKLSEAYETLERTMLHLDDATIGAITKPLSILLKRFQDIITDGTLAELFGKGVEAAGNFFADTYAELTDTVVDNQVLDFEYMLKNLSKVQTDESQKLYAKYEAQFKGSLEALYKSAPEQMKGILERKGLLDKSGNLKANMSVDAMRDALMFALMSNNKSFAKQAESVIGDNLNLDQFKEDARGLVKTIDKNKKKLAEKVFGSTGINRIYERLFEGVSELVEEGMPLFKGIFYLGQSIMGGLVKGFVIGTTALLNIVNGKVDAAHELLGKHIEGLKGKNIFVEWLGFKDGELESMSDNLAQEANKIGSKGSDKLLPVFKIIKDEIFGMGKAILDIVSSLISKTINESYKGAKPYQKAFLYYYFNDVIDKAAANSAIADISSQDSASIGKSLAAIETKTENDDGWGGYIGFDFSWTDNKSDDYFNEHLKDRVNKIGEKSGVDGFFSGLGDQIEDVYESRNQMESALPLFVSATKQIQSEYETLLKSNNSNINKGFITFQNKMVAQTLNSINSLGDNLQSADDMTLSSFLNSMLEYILDFQEKKYIKKNQLKAGNDVIKLHDNDEVEVVASKQGGLLRKAYFEISQEYKKKVEEIKVLKNKSSVLGREDIDYEEEETLVLDLLGRINNYIEAVSQRKPAKVVQNNVRFAGQ